MEIPPADPEPDGQPSEHDLEVLVSTAMVTLSAIIVDVTKQQELEFTPQEVDLLTKSWAKALRPFIKSKITPMWDAVLATLVIGAAKAAIYAQFRAHKQQEAVLVQAGK